MGSGGRGDIVGRLIGMLVFLLGVGLLIFVFIQATRLFGVKPADALGLTFTGDPKKDPTLALIGSRFVGLLLEIGILFLMAFAGSLVAQKGINLYFSALQHVRTATPQNTAPPVDIG